MGRAIAERCGRTCEHGAMLLCVGIERFSGVQPESIHADVVEGTLRLVPVFCAGIRREGVIEPLAR